MDEGAIHFPLELKKKNSDYLHTRDFIYLFFISGNAAISTVQVTHYHYSKNRNLPTSQELAVPN